MEKIIEKLNRLEDLLEAESEVHNDCFIDSCHGSSEPCIYWNGAALIDSIKVDIATFLV